MIMIFYINYNINLPYNILITGIKRIKQYPTDLDIQCGFQGWLCIKLISTYVFFYLCNKCIIKMNSMFKTDV